MTTVSLLSAGTRERQDDTTHVVSRWEIPGGTDYHNATAIWVFFPNEASAQTYAKKWEMPPEMAMVSSIEQYDHIREINRAICPSDQ